MKRFLILAICILLVLPISVQALNTCSPNCYVGKNGSNSNGGTITAPWLTINYSAGQVVPGDTVTVFDGTYMESVQVRVSGNASGWITFQGQSYATIINGSNSRGTNRGIFYIDGETAPRKLTHIKIRGFNITWAYDNSLQAYGGIMVRRSYPSSPMNNITIENNRISETDDAGIYVKGGTNTRRYLATDINIINNTVYNYTLPRPYRLGLSRTEGISMSNTKDVNVSYNTVSYNGHIYYNITNWWGGEGIVLKDFTENGIISNNEVHHLGRSWASFYNSTVGIFVDSQLRTLNNVLIFNNVVHDIHGKGIVVETEMGGSLTNVSVYNNIVYRGDMPYTAAGCFRNGYMVDQSNSSYNTSAFRNISFYNNVADGIGCIGDSNGAFYMSGNSKNTYENINVKNNIITNTFWTKTMRFPSSAEAHHFNISHNLVFNESIVTNSSLFKNGIVADPKYVDRLIHNYHIKSTSPARDAGTITGLPFGAIYDKDDVLRGSLIDIGAYEYTNETSPTIASPLIVTYNNTYTDNSTLGFSIPKNTTVTFNVLSVNQSINNYVWRTRIAGTYYTQASIGSTFTTSFVNQEEDVLVDVTANNSNGTSNTITWTINVTPYPVQNIYGIGGIPFSSLSPTYDHVVIENSHLVKGLYKNDISSDSIDWWTRYGTFNITNGKINTSSSFGLSLNVSHTNAIFTATINETSFSKNYFQGIRGDWDYSSYQYYSVSPRIGGLFWHTEIINLTGDWVTIQNSSFSRNLNQDLNVGISSCNDQIKTYGSYTSLSDMISNGLKQNNTNSLYSNGEYIRIDGGTGTYLDNFWLQELNSSCLIRHDGNVTYNYYATVGNQTGNLTINAIFNGGNIKIYSAPIGLNNWSLEDTITSNSTFELDQKRNGNQIRLQIIGNNSSTPQVINMTMMEEDIPDIESVPTGTGVSWCQSGCNNSWNNYTILSNVSVDWGSHNAISALMSEPFTDGDKNGSVTVNGTWDVVNGVLNQSDSTSYRHVLYFNGSYQNFDLLALVKKTNVQTGNVELIGRLQNSTSYYFYSNRGVNSTSGLDRIRESTSGTETTLGSTTNKVFTQNQYNFLRFRANGSSLSGKSWNMSIAEPASWNTTVMDTSYSIGAIGLSDYGNRVEYDNIQVRALDSLGNIVTHGNITVYNNSETGTEIYQANVNVSIPTGLNYSVFYSTTGSNFVAIGGINSTNQTFTIPSPNQTMYLKIQLNGNETSIAELVEITLYSQTASSETLYPKTDYTYVEINGVWTGINYTTNNFTILNATSHSNQNISFRTVNATDLSMSAQRWYNFTVENNNGTINNISLSTIHEGDTLQLYPEYADIDVDIPVWDTTCNGSINSSTGQLSWITTDGMEGNYYCYLFANTTYENISKYVNINITNYTVGYITIISNSSEITDNQSNMTMYIWWDNIENANAYDYIIYSNSINTSDRLVQYDGVAFHGTVNVSVRPKNEYFYGDWMNVTLNASNIDPVFDEIGSVNVSLGDTLLINISGEYNPEGDTLTYSINGTNATINSTIGNITWTPDTVGNYSYLVTVTDNYSASFSSVMDVEVHSAAPIFNTTTLYSNITSIYYTENTILKNLSIDSSFYGRIDLVYDMYCDHATEACGINVTKNNATLTSDYIIATQTAIAATANFTANWSYNDTFQINYVNTMQPSYPTNELFSISYNNSDIKTYKDSEIIFYVNAIDSDGDTLTYSVNGTVNINASTGRINWTPNIAGNYSVNVSVNDGHGNNVSHIIQIEVLETESTSTEVLNKIQRIIWVD